MIQQGIGNGQQEMGIGMGSRMQKQAMSDVAVVCYLLPVASPEDRFRG
jgi:hypothetical protein